VQDPRFDVPAQGDRSPYLDQYLAANTTTLGNVGKRHLPAEGLAGPLTKRPSGTQRLPGIRLGGCRAAAV
jgi:hypothetical protein